MREAKLAPGMRLAFAFCDRLASPDRETLSQHSELHVCSQLDGPFRSFEERDERAQWLTGRRARHSVATAARQKSSASSLGACAAVSWRLPQRPIMGRRSAKHREPSPTGLGVFMMLDTAAHFTRLPGADIRRS